jgi:hypothetical protein
MSMVRIACLILAGCVLALVLLDPYTLNHDASDLVMPGPWWQMLLGIMDLALLTYLLVLLWKRRSGAAFRILVTETVLSLVTVFILVQRDGIGRFRMGFGAQDYLWTYLLAMGLRAALLALLAPVGERLRARGET